MKVNRLFLMALAAGMMVSCSDEATAPETGVRPSQGETGYIALSINMPQTSGSGTRANDSFNDGIPAEYHANDATLILFTGTSESEATVKGVYAMNNLVPKEEDGNITVKYNTVQQITNPVNSTEKLYAMVVLNKSGLITVSGTDGATSTLNGQNMVGLKFTDFTAAAADYLLTDANLGAIANVAGSNFLMSNAPLADKPGYTADPSSAVINTLVEVDQNNIYPSETAARSGEATEITVERAVAKVTVTSSANSSAVTGTAITDFNIDGWTLCNTNKKSYFTRNVDCGTPSSPSWWGYQAHGSADHRFIGSNEVYKTDADPAVSYYRTYWAKDPNYGSYVSTDFNVVEGIPASLNNLDTDAYCLENTFNVANQNQNQTTGVIVKATLKVTGAEKDNSFFTLNGDKSTIYTFANMLNKAKAFYLEDADVEAACDDEATGLASGKQLDVSDLVVELTNSDGTTKVTLDGTGDAISDFTKAGNYTLTSIYVKDASASKFKKGVLPEALKSTNTALIETIKNNVGTISYYENGAAYYYVLIRHFDETQTPWEADKLAAAVLSGSYPNNYQGKTAEENWLGRYGVVRNNWYQVTVTGIAQIGDAEAPIIPGKPDDTREQWIKAEINVLSWAVRTQNAVLGDKW